MTAMQLADRTDVDPLAKGRVQLLGLTVAIVAGAAVPPACQIGRTRLVTPPDNHGQLPAAGELAGRLPSSCLNASRECA